jgi:hypothetical protein
MLPFDPVGSGIPTKLAPEFSQVPQQMKLGARAAVNAEVLSQVVQILQVRTGRYENFIS